MFSINPTPKFFLLNGLRALSMVSLLFVFIANLVIMAQDIQAIQHPVTDAAHEDCDYVENSGVPNQPLGTFRAFFIIALNIVETMILFLSETGFPAVFFKNWLPCLDSTQSLVALGAFEILLAAQMMSHFLDPFPLVACFFLLIAGIFNILTMYCDQPRFYRSYMFWKTGRPASPSATVESGLSRAFSQARSHSHYASTSAAPSIFTEKEQMDSFGWAKAGNPNLVARSMSPPSVSRNNSGRIPSPPTYSPSPQAPSPVMTKGRNVF